MPGSQRNGWSSYLNGGTSHYNFSYKDDIPISEPLAQLPAISNNPPSPFSTKNKKQTGGKRKSKRHTKQTRQSRRK